MSLIFKYLEDQSINISMTHFKPFYWCLLISCILTYLLAVTWSTPTTILFLTNSIGVIIQLAGLYFLIMILRNVKEELKTKIKKRTLRLLLLSFYLLALKIVMQSLVALPSLAVISYTIRNFVIGFIHLLMLGVLSVFIFGFLHEFRSVSSKLEGVAINIFLTAFYITELLLFLQGLLLWSALGFISGYYVMIFMASILFPLAITIFLIDLISMKRIETLKLGNS